ncbi:MaoC/PaaZ C-terminal domain-containing protein [Haladaptatus sp. DFWS20]|uniref:MaoC/PaaZ C-terminal domain-containing protein n=1 Tax=Haladaptatus sp. DFWS20 TaxID=3403467 RepID=UPI003EB724D0
MTVPAPGDSYTYERTFRNKDVRQFGRISGDQQAIHTEPNGDGHLIAQGLLTATLFTKIAGDLSFLARRTDIRYHKPVHTNNTITCKWVTDAVDEQEDRYEMTCSVTCTNGDGDVVLTAHIEGLIWKHSS